MASALDIFERAQARGLRFNLLGGGLVGIQGPAPVLREMNDEIDAHADSLVAIVEEFSSGNLAIQAAEAIIRRRTKSKRRKQRLIGR